MRGPGRLSSVAPGALVVAAVGVLVMVAASGRYGYHRDELYFLRAGRHLAWGYPDQPPLTPLLARLMDELAPGSLVVLRLPSALAYGGVILLTSLIARRLGADRRAQTFAAVSAAVGTLFVVTGHLLSTTTFDLLIWGVLTLLVLALLQGADPRLWLVVGAVAGVGLLNKQLVAFLLAALLVAILLTGPRDVLRSGWLWAGGAVALALWSPHLLWQAEAGWPALEVAAAVADGGSVSSEPPELFLPFQLVLVGPLLVPVWVAGLVVLWRDRRTRSLPVAVGLLVVVFQLTGGKPYYLGGMYPLLLGAGAAPAVRWLSGSPGRKTVAAAGLAVSAAVSAVIALPVVPLDRIGRSPVLDVNEDAGETIGWPAFVAAVAAVRKDAGGDAVVLTANYGQAGAVDRYGRGYGLPAAYSGHNGYADWGTPPEDDVAVVAVGFRPEELTRWFASCDDAAVVDNGLGIDNEEQGTVIRVCRDRRSSWAQLWPDIRRLG